MSDEKLPPFKLKGPARPIDSAKGKALRGRVTKQIAAEIEYFNRTRHPDGRLKTPQPHHVE